MANRVAQTADLNCPHCRHTASYEIWLTVGGNARPNLLARIRPQHFIFGQTTHKQA